MKNTTIIKIVSIYFFFIVTIFGQNTITVCSSNCDFQDIQKAIDSAPPFSTILVKEDLSLQSTIIIKKPLTLKGEAILNRKPILNGNFHKNVILVKDTENVSITNLNIQNSGSSDIEEFAGIQFNKVKNCHASDNVLYNNTYGIYLANTQDCVVENNVFYSFYENEVKSGNGIHLWYSYKNTLKNNVIFGHRDGLYFENSEDLIVEHNRIYNNLRYGIHFMFCSGSQIQYNIVDNPTGIALMYSKQLNLSNNVFKNSWGNSFKALLLKDINSSIVSNNLFYNNSTGIFTDNSNNNKIFNNKFLNNGIALEILGNSYYNEFYHNIFENNIFDVATNSRDNLNKYYENYWDKYRGYDLDKDGYGDVPYRPVSLFSYWVSRYPTLSILIRSPMVDFLELLEKVYPVITPSQLMDEKPIIKRKEKEHAQNSKTQQNLPKTFSFKER